MLQSIPATSTGFSVTFGLCVVGFGLAEKGLFALSAVVDSGFQGFHHVTCKKKTRKKS